MSFLMMLFALAAASHL